MNRKRVTSVDGVEAEPLTVFRTAVPARGLNTAHAVRAGVGLDADATEVAIGTIAPVEEDDLARQEFKDAVSTEMLLRTYGVGPVPRAEYGEYDFTTTLQDAIDARNKADLAWTRLLPEIRAKYANWTEVMRAVERGELTDEMIVGWRRDADRKRRKAAEKAEADAEAAEAAERQKLAQKAAEAAGGVFRDPRQEELLADEPKRKKHISDT